MPGQPGHKTQPYARLPPSFLDMDAWMASQRSYDSQAMWSLMCLAYYVDMLSRVFVQPGTGRCPVD